jgi:DNA-binding response OmpR family regulator
MTSNNEKLRILLCEDDENLGMLLREYVQAKGFLCDLFNDGDAGYKAYIRVAMISASST